MGDASGGARSDGWWTFDATVAAGTIVKVGLVLHSVPAAKSRVLLVRGLRDGEPVEAADGLGWSPTLQSHYLYVGDGSVGWLSWPITFKGVVDHIRLAIRRWPSRKPVPRSDVRRVFLQTQESSLWGGSAAKSLVLPAGEVGRG